MKNITMGLVALSALGFAMAVLVNLVTGPIAGVGAEGFSRACTNLALLAIAVTVCFPTNEEDGAES